MQNLDECLEANDENSASANQIKSVTTIARSLTEEIDDLRKPTERISNNQLIKSNQKENLEVIQIEQHAISLKSNVSYFLQLDEQNEEVVKHFNLEAEKRNQAQIKAAKRCLQTNSLLGLVFLLL